MRAWLSRSANKLVGAGRIPYTWAVMLGGLLGFALGPLLLVLFAWPEIRELWDGSGPFTLWSVLIGMQTLLWILALPPLLRIRRHHAKQRSALSVRQEAVPSALFLVALVGLLILGASTNPVAEFLPHLTWKVRVLTVLALVVALVASLSVWLIRGRLERLFDEAPTKENIVSYSEMRADLDRLLAYLGAVVGLAVLSSAAMRNVVRSEGTKQDLADFPAEAVIIYGLVLSFILAAVYLPTLTLARAVGARFRDQLVPFPPPDALVDGFEKRKRLDDVLGLTVSATASFRAAVAILSPLIGGLASLLPKIGGG